MGEYADISERIRSLRKSRSMSQDELARILGVTKVAVSQWERGVNEPKMEMRQALCDVFNVNMEYLNGNWDHITRLVTEREMLALDSGALDDGGYYASPETAAIAQEVFEKPGLRALFDAAKDASPEAIQQAAQILKILKGGDSTD